MVQLVIFKVFILHWVFIFLVVLYWKYKYICNYFTIYNCLKPLNLCLLFKNLIKMWLFYFPPFSCFSPLYLHITIHHLLSIKQLYIFTHCIYTYTYIYSKSTNTICCIHLSLFSVYVFGPDHLVLDNKSEDLSMGRLTFLSQCLLIIVFIHWGHSIYTGMSNDVRNALVLFGLLCYWILWV